MYKPANLNAVFLSYNYNYISSISHLKTLGQGMAWNSDIFRFLESSFESNNFMLKNFNIY